MSPPAVRWRSASGPAGVPSPEPAPERRAALEEFATRSRLLARREQVDAVGREVIDALETAGVEVRLLKGAALARSLYRDAEARGYFDVDLLVASSRLDQARRVLRERGFRNRTERRGIADDVAGTLHADDWYRLVPDHGAVSVDLHWRLQGCGAPAEDQWRVLSAESGVVELSGGPAQTLAAAGQALHLALHAVQHGVEDIKAIGDLRLGLERWPVSTWREAADLAGELEATEAMAGGLRLLPAGAVLADRLGLPPAEAVLWELAQRDARPRGTFHLQALREARTLSERLYVLRRALLPSRAWIVWEHPGAARSPIRLALGYAVHLARTPAWALRAYRFQRRKGPRPGAWP